MKATSASSFVRVVEHCFTRNYLLVITHFSNQREDSSYSLILRSHGPKHREDVPSRERSGAPSAELPGAPSMSSSSPLGLSQQQPDSERCRTHLGLLPRGAVGSETGHVVRGLCGARSARKNLSSCEASSVRLRLFCWSGLYSASHPQPLVRRLRRRRRLLHTPDHTVELRCGRNEALHVVSFNSLSLVTAAGRRGLGDKRLSTGLCFRPPL